MLTTQPFACNTLVGALRMCVHVTRIAHAGPNEPASKLLRMHANMQAYRRSSRIKGSAVVQKGFMQMEEGKGSQTFSLVQQRDDVHVGMCVQPRRQLACFGCRQLFFGDGRIVVPSCVHPTCL